jgi:hypothetical protein
VARARRDSAEQAPETSTRWWSSTGTGQTNDLWGWVDRMRTRQRLTSGRDLIHEAIYEGRPIASGQDVTSIEMMRRQQMATANLNITRSMVDTVVARLGRRRPMPVISADDAEYSEKLYAKRASRVMRRKLSTPTFERLSPTILRDAVVRGTGVVRVFPRRGDVHYARVPRHELVVDPQDARYCAPRVIAHARLVPREIVLQLYPDRASDIRQASRGTRDEWEPYGWDTSKDDDQIEMVEAWHLPSTVGAEDGRYVCAIRTGIPLESCEWERPRFPFAFLHWSPPMRGFWGQGLVEDLAGIQSKVNSLARDAQEAFRLASALKVFVPRSSNVDKNHLRAKDPAVIEYDGNPPQFIAPNPASEQQLQFLRWLIQQAYEISGISQAAAQSRNPLGPNASGKALDTMYDMESDRFSHVEMQYAQFRCDVGQLTLDLAQDLTKPDEDDDDDDNAPLAPWIKAIKWPKFDVDGGSYHLVLEPINFLPETRAGKLDTVADMAKAGVIADPMVAASLFDEPDIARANRAELGPYRYLESIMEKLADTSVPLEDCVPTPQMNLSLAKRMALGEHGNAAAEGADDVLLGRYRWFLQMLDGEEQQLQPPPAPPGPPGPQQPGPAPSMPGAPPPMPPMPGNGMGGLDAQAAAGMPVPMLAPGVS